MSDRILIVDDDLELCGMLERYLVKFGFQVASANDSEAGLAKIDQFEPHLMVLDIMLPKRNGFELCQQIRRTSQLPILFLSARGDVSDRVVGLEFGADDFISKPFEPRELVARIQTVLRRTRKIANKNILSVLRAGDLVLDMGRREVSLGSEKLSLTTLEFEILLLLMSRAGEVVSREVLSEELKGINWDGMDRSIDIGISRLRQKLADSPKNPTYLKTVWGSGYLFAREVVS